MSRSTAKGTAWASKIVDYLRAEGWIHAERRSLNGNKDRGDIAGLPGVVIEAKNCQRFELATWLNEAHTEGANDGGSLAVVWAHRPGKGSAEDGYVVMSGATLVALLHQAGW